MHSKVIAITALLVAAAPAAAQQLPRDPGLVQGQFNNGVSYVIRQHDNPPGRFSAWLHVKAGALHETEAQNGVAHFLEHMAFNGSENYAAGTLVPKLNELGMKLGADSNAHTSIDETVFKLTMPDNSDATLDTALTVLGDFAHGLLLAETEIDHERGVILEEKRSGLGPSERISKQVRPWLFAGSKLEHHDVIGSEEVIEKAPREEFASFWDTWYRPELLTLIVVGDIDPERVVAEAEKHLGHFEARAAPQEFAGSGVRPTDEARARVITDPEIAQGSVQLASIAAGHEPSRTEEEYLQRVRERIGHAALAQRLRDMVQKGEAPWLFAQAGVQSFIDFDQATALAVGRPAQWEPMVTGLVAELKRAQEHGFTAQEVDRVYREMISAAEQAVETETTIRAAAHVQRIVRAVNRGSVLMSAAQRLQLLRKLDGVTPEAIDQAFVATMGAQTFSYLVVLPAADDLPSDTDVLAVAERAWQSETAATDASSEALAIMTELPEPGVEAGRSVDEELGITTVEFENGVVMHHRAMDRPANSVAVAVTIPGGSLEETASNRGVTEVSTLVGATSRMDSLQIRDALVGTQASASVGATGDAISVSIRGATKDLEAGMQLAHEMIRDGRIESSAFDSWQQQMRISIEQAPTDLQEQFSRALTRIRMGDDPRFQPLTEAEVDGRSIEEAEKWLRRILSGAPMEVAVVGDMPLERAVELVARYFGSLPEATRGFDCMEAARQIELPEGAQAARIAVPTVTDKAMVLVGFRGCDADQLRDRRALELCADILTDRMRVRVREEENLVYSIQCVSRPGSALPGTGAIFAAAPTDPATADRLADTLLEMMQTFATEGPTAEELAVARAQAKQSLDKAVTRPYFWLAALADFRYRGRDLVELHDLDTAYDPFTIEDLQETAARYFTPVRELRVVAVPKAGN